MATHKVLIRVKHVYENDSQRFEQTVNTALRDLSAAGAVIDEIHYASDSVLSERHRAGYGALIVYEIAADKVATIE